MVDDDDLQIVLQETKDYSVTDRQSASWTTERHSIASGWIDASHTQWFDSLFSDFRRAIVREDFAGRDVHDALKCIQVIEAAYQSRRPTVWRFRSASHASVDCNEPTIPNAPAKSRASDRDTGTVQCRKLRRMEDELLAPGSQSYALLAGIVVERAQGSTITDVDGDRLLDIIGGIAVGGIGHSHAEWARSVSRQAADMAVGSYTSRARIELLERLSRHAPAPDIRRTQIYSSGAEAIELALRLAKSHTGKHEFVSFAGGSTAKPWARCP